MSLYFVLFIRSYTFSSAIKLLFFRTKDPESCFYKETGKENLLHMLVDLFLAGTETTSTTLAWAILYMVREEEVQKKVQEELDRVVGEFSKLKFVQSSENWIHYILPDRSRPFFNKST